MAMVSQDRPLHVLQQFIDAVAVGVHQLKALDLGFSGSCVGQPGSPPGLSPTRGIVSSSLFRERWGQSPTCHCLGCLAAPGEKLGKSSYKWQSVRGRASTPVGGGHGRERPVLLPLHQ